MSATAWRYVAPWKPDFQQVLEELRAQAFARGAYLQPWTDREHAVQQPDPDSIDEAIARCGSQGTHSILDIAAFSLVPGPGLACLVHRDELLRIYGTDRPSREDVDDRRFGLVHTLEEGQARVVVVYQDDEPHKLVFEGITGG